MGVKQVARYLALLGLALWLQLAAGTAQDMLRVEPLTIVTDDASSTFSAEVADTPESRERGLMFRHILPADQAMLFDFGQPRPLRCG